MQGSSANPSPRDCAGRSLTAADGVRSGKTRDSQRQEASFSASADQPSTGQRPSEILSFGIMHTSMR